jgi:hypothetical protein
VLSEWEGLYILPGFSKVLFNVKSRAPTISSWLLECSALSLVATKVLFVGGTNITPVLPAGLLTNSGRTSPAL